MRSLMRTLDVKIIVEPLAAKETFPEPFAMAFVLDGLEASTIFMSRRMASWHDLERQMRSFEPEAEPR